MAEQETVPSWGRCPECWQVRPVARDGRLMFHRRWREYDYRGEALGAMVRCDGTGRSPADVVTG